MMGGDLPHSDAWTTSLLTNREWIEADQHSTGNHAALTSPNAVVWLAKSTKSHVQYVAVFNISESEQKLQYSWKQLGLSAQPVKLRELWDAKESPAASQLEISLAPHACVMYAVTLK